MNDDYQLPPEFADKYGPWALIAGGSEGVGESFARMLAGVGINLVLLARREGPLDSLASSIRSEYEVEVRIGSVDLTRAGLLAQVTALTGDIDVGLMIYNAGSSIGYNRFPDWKSEDLDFMIKLNCHAPVHLAHHYAKGMCERGRGGLMFLSSMAGFSGSAWMTIYPATKAFDQMLAEGLWHDLKPSGVDAMCLVLGATKTPSHAHVAFDKFTPDGGMECDDAAWEGLSHLGHGPLWVAGEGNRARLPEGFIEERAIAIDRMSWGTAIINDLEHQPATDATRG
ncbi:MAG: SDR family NAD(P)-dependent oxidoreductase [Gammaproteobacteria bacterium]|nr:SDR family NAD(P)-dependent oxidoreductase [Gammaproteobacteria bacterium]